MAEPTDSNEAWKASQERDNRAGRETDERILEKILGFERATHDKITTVATKISVIETQQKYTADDIAGLRKSVTDEVSKLVSKIEFSTVKTLVFGMAGIILAAVATAFVTSALK